MYAIIGANAIIKIEFEKIERGQQHFVIEIKIYHDGKDQKNKPTKNQSSCPPKKHLLPNKEAI